MPDTAPNNSPAPVPQGQQGAPAPASLRESQQTGGPAQALTGASGIETKPPALQSFGQRMEKYVADQGQEFGLDDNGRVTIQPLAKPETIEGHSVEDLEKIARGEQPTGKPDGQGDDEEQRQQAAGRQAPAAPTSPAAPSAPDPLQAKLDKLTDIVALLLEERKAGAGQAGTPAAAAPAAPVHTPSSKDVRDAIAKRLETAGLDTELADILVEFNETRERELREQIARDYNLPTLSLQSDLVRLYNQFGDDFKAALPAIELIRKSDPSISVEAAYKGVKAIGQALGHIAPANGAPAGAQASEPPSQPRVLTPEEAKALLAKRDLMRSQSGVSGTEARASKASKQSFGEMLHQNLATARRAGRAGG